MYGTYLGAICDDDNLGSSPSPGTASAVGLRGKFWLAGVLVSGASSIPTSLQVTIEVTSER